MESTQVGLRSGTLQAEHVFRLVTATTGNNISDSAGSQYVFAPTFTITTAGSATFVDIADDAITNEKISDECKPGLLSELSTSETGSLVAAINWLYDLLLAIADYFTPATTGDPGVGGLVPPPPLGGIGYVLSNEGWIAPDGLTDGDTEGQGLLWNDTAGEWQASTSLLADTAQTKLGTNVTISGNLTTAVGRGAFANADYSTAIGAGAKGQAIRTTALGIGSNAEQQRATAIGNDSAATGQYSTALGTNTAAVGANSVAVGTTANSSGVNAIAIGNSANGNSTSAVAVGESSRAGNSNAVALGYSAFADGDSALSLGRNSNASAANSIVLGQSSSATASGAVTVGYNLANALSNSYLLGKIRFMGNLGTNLTEISDANHGTREMSMYIEDAVKAFGLKYKDSLGVVRKGRLIQFNKNGRLISADHAVTSGQYDNVVLPDAELVRAFGATGNFSFTGFADPFEDQFREILNDTNYDMTLWEEDIDSTAAYRCRTGTVLGLDNLRWVRMWYSAGSSRWQVTNYTFR